MVTVEAPDQPRQLQRAGRRYVSRASKCTVV
jgi:hypothetical protein